MSISYHIITIQLCQYQLLIYQLRCVNINTCDIDSALTISTHEISISTFEIKQFKINNINSCDIISHINIKPDVAILDDVISIRTVLLPRVRVLENYFLYFSSKTYVVGTQKNQFNETVPLSTLNTCLI